MTAPALASPVRDQYEEFPYPPRDPSREREKLWTTLIGQLGAASHALWGGTRRPGPGFRALDAGCGTGDNAIFLGEQLRGPGGNVVAVDISAASLEVARARAAARGLDNIEFVHARIEDLPTLGLGRFDYAVSAGVLHHLPSPAQGLEAIREVLTPGGGIGLMVYGEYGRTGIYLLQQLFRQLAPSSLPSAERVRIVRETLPKLRPDHWGVLGNASWQGEIALHGDAGLFDVFLHSTDRAYTVPQIYDWLEEAGFELVRFAVEPLYNPALYAADLDTAGLGARERHTLAELLSGRMQKHSFYAAPCGESRAAPPSPDDESGVPCWLSFDADGVIARQVELRPELTLDYEGLQLRMPLDPFTRLLLKQVDGRTTLGEVLARQGERFPKAPPAQQRAKWREIHDALSQFNVLGMMAAAQGD
ncbi:MAG: class I SAM-dependent methyltransferase [Trueperaceae bacterium]|nr:class I SAM-dependent methyltransferase [Trueperaceae bacterium]